MSLSSLSPGSPEYPGFPPLSPQQRTFRENPERCLHNLQGRADRLFDDGYWATAASMPAVQ